MGRDCTAKVKLHVHVQYNCFEVGIAQQIIVTLKTIPDGNTQTMEYHVQDTEELWSGITYNPISQELVWELACPIEVRNKSNPVTANLTREMCQSNICIQATHVSQECPFSTLQMTIVMLA
ncbi:UNVERIFIED_CONTAM: hypothetical protein FKN15_033869 [Acipenser sinensis]